MTRNIYEVSYLNFSKSYPVINTEITVASLVSELLL